MTRAQRAIACSAVWAVLLPLAVSQNRPAKEPAGQALQLVSMGGGNLPSGHEFAFRIYATPDGVEGVISMAHFAAPQDAQHQITDWLGHLEKVTKNEHDIKKGQQTISDRIEGVRTTPKSGKQEFQIIRRDDLDCYLIQSVSSKVAAQVEDLIRHN